ncbi:hypothetical protein [Lysinibacillus antri]|uniref:Uncharacterized protein n=1 Tax=Lysinibacillus antri TaxID=2498145 RepID=A0A3S0P3E8_9BACI|nr:hypothetical protein [Lysinibacillus antri]RUL51304.1 hypothetical protein EK386_12535 [Lysinibacillus antri]
MLMELERNTLVLEEQFLLYIAKHAPSLLDVAKEYIQLIVVLPIEERIAQLAEVSEHILQLRKRTQLEQDWMKMKKSILKEKHEDITESMLTIFENNLEHWLNEK